MSPPYPLVLISSYDSFYLDFLQDILIKENYRITIALHGIDTYKIAKHIRPHLILLDISPISSDSAYTMLTLLRLDMQTKDIPILICAVNTHLIEKNTEHLQSMNCDILLKPFLLKDMLMKIHILLSKK